MFIGEKFRYENKTYVILYKIKSIYLFVLEEDIGKEVNYDQYIEYDDVKISIKEMGIKESISFYIDSKNKNDVKNFKKFTKSLNSLKIKLKRI